MNAEYKVTEYNGVDYSDVFDAEYYLDTYADLKLHMEKMKKKHYGTLQIME